MNEKQIEIFKELEEVSRPMIEFLNKHYNPMTTAIITEGKVQIVSTEIAMPLEIKD